MSKSVKKEILASEYSSEQVLAVNTSKYKEMDRSKNDREVKKKLCVWA